MNHLYETFSRSVKQLLISTDSNIQQHWCLNFWVRSSQTYSHVWPENSIAPENTFPLPWFFVRLTLPLPAPQPPPHTPPTHPTGNSSFGSYFSLKIEAPLKFRVNPPFRGYQDMFWYKITYYICLWIVHAIQYNTIQILLLTPHGGFSETMIKIILKNTQRSSLNNNRKTIYI